MFADVGDVAEIPRDQIIDLVIRGDGDVDRVGDVFAVKDAAFDVALGEDGDLLGKVELFERFDKIKAAGAVWLGDAFQLTLDKNRAESTILRQFVLPPSDRQITTKRFAVVEICSDDRCF